MDRSDRLVATKTTRLVHVWFRITYGYHIVVLDPAVSGEAISICATELTLDKCAVLNRLSVNKVRIKEIPKSFCICDLSTFGRWVMWMKWTREYTTSKLKEREMGSFMRFEFLFALRRMKHFLYSSIDRNRTVRISETDKKI